MIGQGKRGFKERVKTAALLLVLLLSLSLFAGCAEVEIVIGEDGAGSQTEVQGNEAQTGGSQDEGEPSGQGLTIDDIPGFSGDAYIAVNDNVPFFTKDEITDESFEDYSALDRLGRCGTAFASVGKDLMPTEKRGNISQVKPTGWQVAKYDFVDGKYLYNRCHLLGFQLTGENANNKNLITGTRYLNIEGMLPFENMVADYVKETNNHVMYRVTPVYEGENLVASGVLMEGYSVEDKGEGVSFCVYAYNAQPGVVIDYATGDNALAEKDSQDKGEVRTYILNTSSKKFHLPECSGANNMKAENRSEFKGTRQELIDMGYEPCKTCNP